jgi:hypothetical protein
VGQLARLHCAGVEHLLALVATDAAALEQVAPAFGEHHEAGSVSADEIRDRADEAGFAKVVEVPGAGVRPRSGHGGEVLCGYDPKRADVGQGAHFRAPERVRLGVDLDPFSRATSWQIKGANEHVSGVRMTDVPP